MSLQSAATVRYFIEQICRIPCAVDIASEYRYRKPLVPLGSLFVTISQSGETADTLAALRLGKESGYLSTLAICNVRSSSAAARCTPNNDLLEKLKSNLMEVRSSSPIMWRSSRARTWISRGIS